MRGRCSTTGEADAPVATPKELARTVVAAVVGPLRATFGRRVVNWTPEFMGFGNQLYLWVWAHAGRLDPVPRKVLVVEKMRPWAAQVPDFARDYLVERSEVRFLDRREHVWASKHVATGHPRGFSREQMVEFVEDCLLGSPLLVGVGAGPLTEPDSLTINVRRGDYYSHEGHRQLHGFDVAGYLRLAVNGAVAADGRPRRIHVVSDD
jgi:hypothetical protein